MTAVVLGIETGCDETGVGVVAGTELMANVLASQVDLHARFGGVVPEVAARAHVESVRHLTHRALSEAGVHQVDLDAVAATRGPGLVGALVVGFTFARSLAWALGKPFIGVNHMEGHLFAPLLGDPAFAPPAVVLLASGGHRVRICPISAWTAKAAAKWKRFRALLARPTLSFGKRCADIVNTMTVPAAKAATTHQSSNGGTGQSSARPSSTSK